MVPVARAFRDGCVEPRDLQVGVRGWWPIPLHVHQPRWRPSVSDLQRLGQLVGELTGPNVAQRCLKLLALIVNVAVAREAGFSLELEESVVEHLVIDVDLAHLGLHPFLLFAFELLRILLLHHRGTDLLDAGGLDELWKLERRLLYTALSHEKFALLAPMLWHRDRVAVALEMDEQPGVGCSDIPLLDNLWLAHQLLQLGDREPLQLLLLLLRHLRLLLLLRTPLLLDGLLLALLALTSATRSSPKQLLGRGEGTEDPRHLRQCGVERHVVPHGDILHLHARISRRRRAPCLLSHSFFFRSFRFVRLLFLFLTTVALSRFRRSDTTHVRLGVRVGRCDLGVGCVHR
mmetsp:Transcript_27665/g.62589  ORF Transcript_27665/g.62589 Transcript_27665/m.62589 type:complete len:346 (-) Transcript_27665:46-1083(-)